MIGGLKHVCYHKNQRETENQVYIMVYIDWSLNVNLQLRILKHIGNCKLQYHLGLSTTRSTQVNRNICFNDPLYTCV
ncbi:hypothetical protein Hanom_Chr09g00830991 [Helianthus anomalus]